MVNPKTTAKLNTTSGLAYPCQVVDITDPQAYYSSNSSSAQPVIFVTSIAKKKKLHSIKASRK